MVRVELINEAVTDLAELVESGKLRSFLKKLVEIEEKGESAGQPLGKELAGFRKLTVGNRDWRIVFRVHDGVATVLVCGDREDSVCYEEAKRRADKHADSNVVTLASAMLGLHGTRKERQAAKRKRKAA